jgi:hypothetical protein
MSWIGCFDFFGACCRCKLRLLSSDDSDTLPLLLFLGVFLAELPRVVRRRVRVRFFTASSEIITAGDRETEVSDVYIHTQSKFHGESSHSIDVLGRYPNITIGFRMSTLTCAVCAIAARLQDAKVGV